jgi:hypothetical protein
MAMAKKIKPHRWWGITYTGPSNDVMPDTIRRTRKESQKACCDHRYRFRDNSDDWREEWQEWHKRGCRAVRVIVTVEATP